MSRKIQLINNLLNTKISLNCMINCDKQLSKCEEDCDCEILVTDNDLFMAMCRRIIKYRLVGIGGHLLKKESNWYYFFAFAAKYNDISVFRLLEPKITILEDDYEHFILNALCSCSMEIIEAIIKKIKPEKLVDPMVEIALTSGNYQAAQLMLDLNPKLTINHLSYLSQCLARDSIQYAKFLIQNNYDLNVEKNNNEQLDLIITYGSCKLIRLFVEAGLSVKPHEYRVMQIAVKRLSYELLDYLVEIGLDIRVNNDHLLLIAVGLENDKLVRYLLGHGLDPNVEDSAAYRIASDSGNFSVVSALLDYGSEMPAHGPDFEVVYIELIEKLMAHKLNSGINKTSYRHMVLHICHKMGWHKIKKLLGSNGMSLKVKSKTKYYFDFITEDNAFEHLVVIIISWLKTSTIIDEVMEFVMLCKLKDLFKRLFDLKYYSSTENLLMMAYATDYQEVMPLIFQKEVDANHEVIHDNILFIIKKNNQDYLLDLLDRGFDPKPEYDKIIRYLIKYDMNKVLERIVTKDLIKSQAETYALLAVDSGKLELLKLFTERGANIHFEVDSLILIACINSYYDCVKYLIDYHMDPEHRTHCSVELRAFPNYAKRLDVIKPFVEGPNKDKIIELIDQTINQLVAEYIAKN